jgi:hypothetical protein
MPGQAKLIKQLFPHLFKDQEKPMGPEFFKTIMGRRFYEGDVPRIAKALEKIAKHLGEEPIKLPNGSMMLRNTNYQMTDEDIRTIKYAYTELNAANFEDGSNTRYPELRDLIHRLTNL